MMNKAVMPERAARALRLFVDGTNCAQAVLMAYGDLAGLTEEQSALLAAGLGGGMGRLRQTCGAFSAAVMLCGALEGKDGGKAENRVAVYQRVQTMYDDMVKSVGSNNCGTLLGRGREEPVPEKRTPDYYATRPCARIILAVCQVIEAQMNGVAGEGKDASSAVWATSKGKKVDET